MTLHDVDSFVDLRRNEELCFGRLDGTVKIILIEYFHIFVEESINIL